jgi:hypothetical protein
VHPVSCTSSSPISLAVGRSEHPVEVRKTGRIGNLKSYLSPSAELEKSSGMCTRTSLRYPLRHMSVEKLIRLKRKNRSPRHIWVHPAAAFLKELDPDMVRVPPQGSHGLKAKELPNAGIPAIKGCLWKRLLVLPDVMRIARGNHGSTRPEWQRRRDARRSVCVSSRRRSTLTRHCSSLDL